MFSPRELWRGWRSNARSRKGEGHRSRQWERKEVASLEKTEKVIVRNFVLHVILLIFFVPICNSLSEHRSLIFMVFQVRAWAFILLSNSLKYKNIPCFCQLSSGRRIILIYLWGIICKVKDNTGYCLAFIQACSYLHDTEEQDAILMVYIFNSQC